MKTANSSNQFRVVVTGNMEYPEDHNDYGTFFKRSEILLCCADSLAKAMECVAEAWSKNQWKFREDKDYFDPDLGKDCGPINFLPEIILIKDKNEKLVLTGHAVDLKWFQKGTPEERQRAIFEKKSLNEAAEKASREDFYTTAQDLRRRAEEVDSTLVDDQWFNHPDVLAAIKNFIHPFDAIASETFFETDQPESWG